MGNCDCSNKREKDSKLKSQTLINFSEDNLKRIKNYDINDDYEVMNELGFCTIGPVILAFGKKSNEEVRVKKLDFFHFQKEQAVNQIMKVKPLVSYLIFRNTQICLKSLTSTLQTVSSILSRSKSFLTAEQTLQWFPSLNTSPSTRWT